MGRRRPKGPPPKPFADAFRGIDLLEQNVVARTTDAQFTPEQLVRAIYPDHIVDKLQAAFPHVRGVDRGTHIRVRANNVPGIGIAEFIIATKPVAMLVPEHGQSEIVLDRWTNILPVLRHVAQQHEQFEKVRQVVRWLNEKATAGAARHYCPWLTSILPADHPFQTAGGTIFREPTASMTAIVPLMRECGAIMAAALLCGEHETSTPRQSVAVQFTGFRTDYDPMDVQVEYQSNAFGLI